MTYIAAYIALTAPVRLYFAAQALSGGYTPSGGSATAGRAV